VTAPIENFLFFLNAPVLGNPTTCWRYPQPICGLESKTLIWRRSVLRHFIDVELVAQHLIVSSREGVGHPGHLS